MSRPFPLWVALVMVFYHSYSNPKTVSQVLRLKACFVTCDFETGSHCEALTVLELSVGQAGHFSLLSS